MARKRPVAVTSEVPTGWTQTVALGSVSNTSGVISLTTPTGAYAGSPALVWTSQTAMADGDWTFDLGSSLAEQYPVIAVRADTIPSGSYPNNGYAIEFQPAAGQPYTSHWIFRKRVAGVSTDLSSGDFDMSSSVRTEVRIQTIGSAIKLRLWLANVAEPSTWTSELTDTSVTAAGRFTVGGNNGAAGTAVTYTVANFAVTPLAVTPIQAAAPTGYTRVFAEDFDDGVGYAEGTFVVGAGGSADDGRLLSSSTPYARYYSKLNLYPDGGTYPNSPSTAQYYTSRTVSTRTAATEPTANGLLNIRMHTATISGTPTAVSGWMRPITPIDVSQKLGYCHVATRMRIKNTSNTSNFGGVIVLIADNWPMDGEIDYPEGAFNEKIGGFFHYADPAATAGTSGSYQLPFYVTPDAFWDAWHVYETFWQPGRLIHKIDGATVLDTTDRVPTASQKLVWQCGVHTNAMPSSGAVAEWQIDWITVDDWN
jgi:hypothetical protein